MALSETAVVKSHVYDSKTVVSGEEKAVKYVHAVLNDVVDSPLTDTIALADIKGAITDAPAVTELRTLRTTCSKRNDGKYAVRAVLRYINIAA